MINPIDDLFIHEISNNLQGFKKSNKNYNFRCPYCGDSAKNIRKQRGWLIDYKGATFFKCFNCGMSASFSTFLKYIDENTYKRYLIYKHQNKSNETNENSGADKSFTNSNITYNDFIKNENIVCCNKLNDGMIYLRNRKNQALDRFFYTSDYGNLLKSLNLKDYDHEWNRHEPRLVIPHWTRDKNLAFLQFRNLDKNAKLRYKTYRVLPDAPKIWGLDKVDWNKPVYICEGAIDASFINNGIAMSGADVDIAHSYINNYKDNLYFILDNEPYNKEICERYKKLYEGGYKVFIWPSVDTKDINDYFVKYNNVNIFTDINNYYKGLKLKLELAKWIKR